MQHDVTLDRAGSRPTLVVPATTSWQEFPALWPVLLDEVWACLRAAGIDRGCRNTMLYRDDVPRVEIGVLFGPGIGPENGTGTARTFPSGRVVRSALPAGRVARTVHRGPYAGLGEAHGAVRHWCAEHGLRPAGPRWEVYGPHREDPAELWVEVVHLLS